MNQWTDFSNLAFLNVPTTPIPQQGLGAAGIAASENGTYVMAGVADRNVEPSDPLESVEQFAQDCELFSHLELGWASSLEKRLEVNFQVTAWYGDAQEDAGVSSG